MTPTTDELRALVERLDNSPEYEMTAVLLSDAALMLRSILAERERDAEAKAQEEYNAGMAFEEYGGQTEGACLYDLYAEHRQFASQEPARRNERGGWDYSV